MAEPRTRKAPTKKAPTKKAPTKKAPTKKADTVAARSPAIDAAAEARALGASLAAHGDPERARWEKAYMKSTLDFVGAGNATVRRLAGEWWRAHRRLDRASVRAVVEALVGSGVFEERSLGVAILARYQRQLLLEDLPWIVELCRHTAAWAHVDWLATDPIASVVGRDPGAKALIRRWAKDPSFWVRRTAILAQLRLFMRGEGDVALFEEITVPMLDEKEFFIRKAIGWALRALSKRRPAPVRAYVEAHGARMSGVTWREAVKYIDLAAGTARPGARPARKAPAKAITKTVAKTTATKRATKSSRCG